MSDETIATPEVTADVATTAPANDNATSAASDAARTLAARRAEIRANLNAKPKETSSEVDSEAVTAAKPDVPAVVDKGPKLDDLSGLIKEQRRIKADKAQLESDRAALKEVEPYIPRIRAAEAAIKAGDKVSAIKALFPGEDLTSDLFWDLAKSIGEQPGDGPKEIDLDKLVADKIAAQRKADSDAAADKVKQAREAADNELNGARGEYLGAVHATFTANAAKYPAIASLGVSSERIKDFVEVDFFKKHGRIPSASETLDELEKEIADRILSTPYARREEAQRAPSPTITANWRSDPGRPTNSDNGPKTLDEIRAARRASLSAKTTG